mmetsp:Transcript_21868/g.62074  ORF Transcript_21868/g.62074 Transcript_21868/m.62074 type:complete len:202 (+) Transcript_21868:101-706(+)
MARTFRTLVFTWEARGAAAGRLSADLDLATVAFASKAGALVPAAIARSSSDARRAKPLGPPRRRPKPREKPLTSMGFALTSSRLPCSRPTFTSCRLSKRVFGLLRALDTLLKPGSFPTTRKSVRPETADVTLPPKLVIIFLALSFPSCSPSPPPTSGKRPVSTKVCPAKDPAGAPLPGTGTTKRSRAFGFATTKSRPVSAS